MLTSGFFNSKSDDRLYDASEFASIFDGLVNDGVYMGIGDHLFVSAISGTMRISIGTGRAWFNHTWTLNTSPYEIELDQSELLQDRIDAVILDVDLREAYRENTFKIIKGIRSTQPQRPELINEEYHKQYPLAYIRVGASVTSISQTNITNMIGTSECPFVTGIIQTINIDSLIANWEHEWDQKMISDTNEFNTWFADMKTQIDENTLGHLLNTLSWMRAIVYANGWSSSTISNLGDGESYYTYPIDYSVLFSDTPSAEITTMDGDTVPTEAQVEAYSNISKPNGWVVVDTDNNKIWLYAKTKPEVDFRIKIQGVA